MKNINKILEKHFEDTVRENLTETGYFKNIYSISFWGWNEDGDALLGWVEADRYEGKVEVSMTTGRPYYYGAAGIYWYSHQAEIEHPEIDE